MSANNTRVRRIIAEILFEEGPLTKEGVAKELARLKSVRTVPSPHSLSSLLCKNIQIEAVGSEIVESTSGVKAKHLLYDIDRILVTEIAELKYSRSPTIMTPKEKKDSRRCSCGRQRVFPPDADQCIHCIRKPTVDNPKK